MWIFNFNFYIRLFRLGLAYVYIVGYSWTDISGIDPAWPLSLHCHFVSPHLHLIHTCTFQLDSFLQVFKNKFVINLFNFCKHSKSAPFHTFIHSPHLIPFHFSVYSSHLYFSWSKKLKLKLKSPPELPKPWCNQSDIHRWRATGRRAWSTDQ